MECMCHLKIVHDASSYIPKSVVITFFFFEELLSVLTYSYQITEQKQSCCVQFLVKKRWRRCTCSRSRCLVWTIFHSWVWTFCWLMLQCVPSVTEYCIKYFKIIINSSFVSDQELDLSFVNEDAIRIIVVLWHFKTINIISVPVWCMNKHLELI